MPELIVAALLLVGAVWLLRGGSRAPGAATALARRVGGIALVTFGVMLAMRGQLPIGIVAMLVGAALARWIALPGFSQARPAANGRVRTVWLDMEIHAGTGAMRGSVLAGRFAGRSLASLQAHDLVALHREVSGDPRSRSVLEAYLDRRAPGWREHLHQDPDAGRARRDHRGRHTMSKEEAHQVLGVKAGAGADEIRQAHRSLMKKVHPDQGGTADLAARVNEAKDVLLGSHPQNS